MTIYLTSNQVPQHLRGSYTGIMFKAEACEHVTIPASAGLWDGGSRDTYHALRLSDGREVDIGGSQRAPWDNSRQDYRFNLEPDVAVVCHAIYRGNDLGLTFFVHPSAIAALLPAPSEELSPVQKLVLTATKSLKSSYAGRDRYQMARSEHHCRSTLNGAPYPSHQEWEAAKAELIVSGHLNKAGAITVKGRNAVS